MLQREGYAKMHKFRTAVALAALMIAGPAIAQSVTETTTVTKSVTVNRGLGAGTQNVCQTVGIVYGLDPYGKTI
jgi:predicted lysophospholipase L1 biosynthesis ABC-type transport system permease subunit